MADEPEFVTVAELAAALGVKRVTVRVILSRHRTDFARPTYRRKNGHPRLVRILDRKEVAIVRGLLGFP